MTMLATAGDIATALNIHKRNVEKRAAKEEWRFEQRAVRGGRRRLYLVEELPSDVLAALAAEAARSALAVAVAQAVVPAANADALSIDFDSRPARIKQQARERLAVVQAHQALCNAGRSRKRATEAIVIAHGLSRSTLMHYLAAVRGQPEHLWIFLLAPRYTGRAAKSELSAEAWEVLKADYLRPERPAASACIHRLRVAAKSRPDWILPSGRTMTRRLKALPRATQILSRQGPKALQQLYPPQQRSRLALRALEIINGDGYKHNVWVRFPDGDVVRAKTWFWQDVYSGKILAWRTDKSEHTEMIRLAFGDVVDAFGIPEAATIDNTMAAANKTMSGGIRTRYRFKVRDEEPDGVFKILGCDVRWATPGHGQAKPVERAFGVGGIGEYVDKAPEFAGAWTGPGPLDKPEYDGRAKCVELAQLVAVIQREIADWNARPGRKSHTAQGRSFDEVFQESYAAAAAQIRRATIAQRRCWLLATEPVNAHPKDGSITLATGRISRSAIAPTQSNRYWAPAMVEYAGKKLAARFDPQQLHVGVHVYSIDGRYVCFADCHAPQGFNDANAAREHARDRKSFMRSQRELLDVERRMTIRQAAKHLTTTPAEGGPAGTIPAAKTVRAEFRAAIERPAYVPPATSPQERAEAERFAARFDEYLKPARPKVHQLRDVYEKYDAWVEIDKRRAAGEALEEDEERFWQQFQTDPYWIATQEAEEKFEREMAVRSA